jgi:hypothetical protein
VIAVFDRNAIGMPTPFNGMIVTGTHDELPNAGVAIIKLWSVVVGVYFNMAQFQPCDAAMLKPSIYS